MAFPVQGKVCGNCEYWKGPRTMGPGNRYAMYNKSSDTGACCYPYVSQTIKHQVNQGGCPRHKMWHEIKN